MSRLGSFCDRNILPAFLDSDSELTLHDDSDDSSGFLDDRQVTREDSRYRQLLRRDQCVRKLWGYLMIFGIVVIVFLGLYIGKRHENWTILTSLYVLMQIVTTIGYGDVTVSSQDMKLFMAFYVLFILVVFASVLNWFIKPLVDSNMSILENVLNPSTSNADHFDEHMVPDSSCHMKCKKYLFTNWRQVVIASGLFFVMILIGTIFFGLVERCSCSTGVTKVDDCDPSDEESCKTSGGYEKTMVDAFYMSVITLTTVGFGDHSPRSDTGRAFALVWCILGVATCVNWLTAVTEYLFTRSSMRKFNLAYLRLNEEVFDQMDSEDTGYLTRHEYIAYVLINSGVVSPDILAHINKEFDLMDPKGTNEVYLRDLRRLKQERRRQVLKELGYITDVKHDAAFQEK